MKNKNSRAQLQMIFGALLLMLTLFAELYVMINQPELVVLIVGFAVLGLICLYVVIDGYLSLRDQKEFRSEEQYNNIFKSEKASYLLLKKHFEEIEEKLDYLEQASRIPAEEVINAQKGIAKVVIGRTHEDAEALIGSNDALAEKLSGYEKRLEELIQKTEDNKAAIAAGREAVTAMFNSGRDAVLEGQKTVSDSSDKSQQMREQELIVHLKDMELRLNSAIMQLQKVMAQTPVMTAPVQMVQTPVQMMAHAEATQTVEAVHTEPTVEPEAIAEPEPMVEPEAVAEPEPVVEPEAVAEPEPMVEPEAVAEPEPIVEEKLPMPDLSDPNKPMSPDDIAALFASMGTDTPAAPEPEPEPIVEEKPPMPDLSDPNKPMSPDDIAALFASMGS